MAKMTEEHKQKMAEGRKRAAEQRKAEEEARKARAEAAQRAEAEGAEVSAPRHTSPPKAGFTDADPVAVEYGGQQEWGPFPKFQEVHTQYGIYGLPAHQVMHFVEVEEMLEGKMILTHKPVYREVARPR